MPILINKFTKIIEITSPTVEVDAQVLHDTIEDYMASPRGMINDGAWDAKGDILKPEGKIEDDAQPGVFSQIILILNPEWQYQFWAGSGYTRIFGGKLVGGVAGEPMKATGAAGDITVLESPVDGLVVATGSGVTQQDKDDIENQIFARLIEGGESFEVMVRLMRAAAAGSIVALGDGTYKIKGVAGVTDRIEGEPAANSGRSITSTDGS